MSFRARAGVACVVLAVAALIAGCGGSSRPPSPAPVAAELTVGAAPVGPALPTGFLGLSFEYTGLAGYAGTDPAALDPVFVRLMQTIAPSGGPVLRLGGDSTDWGWWPVPGLAKPGGMRFALTPQLAAVARALAARLGAQLILGINFEADSSRIAAYEAAQLIRRIGVGSIDALELGNEPELYAGFGWYHTAAGVQVPGRAPGWTFSRFLADYSTIAAALPTTATIAGPSTGAPAYLAQLGTFARAEPGTKLITIHAYPLKRCNRTSPPPTVAQLLAPDASQGLVDELEPYIAAARAAGDDVRLDEMNSVSCGGWGPVTYSYGAALWALQTIMRLTRSGVVGVNFHTIAGTTQHLIRISHAGGVWRGEVLPEFYGLAAFTQADPAGSRPLAIAGTTPAGLSVFALRTAAGSVHLVLVNTGGAADRLTVRLPGRSAAGSISLLRGPGLDAQSGVTLGGQHVDGATGALTGTRVAGTVTPSRPGLYTIDVPSASAAIVSVP